MKNQKEQKDNLEKDKKVSAEQKKDEVAELKADKQKLEEEIQQLIQQNKKLELEIQKQQEDYINKIKEKQDEIIAKLKQKQDELVILNEEKLNAFKLKLFSKDIIELIETIEQFNKVLEHPAPTPEINNYLLGFKMFANMFDNALNNMGIVKVQIKNGDEFDHDTMEVIEVVEDATQAQNTVCQILSNAYKYQENVIKFAKVKIVK